MYKTIKDIYFRADPKLSTEELLAKQKESIKVVEDESVSELDVHSTLRINSTDYCVCKKCKPMKSAEESVCCKERKISPHIMAGKIIQFGQTLLP